VAGFRHHRGGADDARHQRPARCGWSAST
jgi:hypothetical protein